MGGEQMVEEVKPMKQLEPAKMREIHIGTDGNSVFVIKDESSSMLEFAAVLQAAVQQRAMQRNP